MATIMTCFGAVLRIFAARWPPAMLGAGAFTDFDGEGMRCSLESRQSPDDQAA
ncbi:MAG: hypothetical protein WC617_11010 [Rhodanobacter sp.]|jgi:hypothetical protein